MPPSWFDQQGVERLRRARYHWREGRANGYPTCCIAHFCLDTLAGWKSAPLRSDPNDVDGRVGVVCGIFHAGRSELSLLKRLIEIVQWQWIYVRPGARGKAFRRAVGPAKSSDSWQNEEEIDPDLNWY